jgi:transposase InsO family protein
VPDLIGRDFTATDADQRWCGDIPARRDRRLYLATVIDIATRRLIGGCVAGHSGSTAWRLRAVGFLPHE